MGDHCVKLVKYRLPYSCGQSFHYYLDNTPQESPDFLTSSKSAIISPALTGSGQLISFFTIICLCLIVSKRAGFYPVGLNGIRYNIHAPLSSMALATALAATLAAVSRLRPSPALAQSAYMPYIFKICVVCLAGSYELAETPKFFHVCVVNVRIRY